VPAQLTVDGFSANAIVKGQAISPSILPDFVQEKVKNEVEFRQGIGELEALIAQGESEGVIRLGLPMGSEIAGLMNVELQAQYRSIERIYWSVVPAAVRGVTDQVRTRSLNSLPSCARRCLGARASHRRRPYTKRSKSPFTASGLA